MSKFSKQYLYNSCVTDLRRSALSFVANPQGKSHLIFLEHALGVLKDLKDKKAQKFLLEIFDVEKKISETKSKKEIINLADKMLTLGSILKR